MSKNIDKIFYINLDKRPDRKEAIESELTKFSLINKSERYSAIETEQGFIGCAYSHLNVLKLAKEKNYNNVLILEDDFTFIISPEEFEQELTNFFSTDIPYDVIMISYNIIKHQTLENIAVDKIIEAQTASGYIVHSNYYQKLIDLFEDAIPKLEETYMHWVYANDQIWKQYQPNDNWYFFKKRIGIQRPDYSDNSNCFVDYEGV